MDFKHKHEMYSSVKYEDIKINELLAITISPADQHNSTISMKEYEHIYKVKDRRGANMRHVRKTLHQLTGSRYRLVFEYSPLGIMHYHGYIQIYDPLRWMDNDIGILKVLGHFCVKKIEDGEAWKKYINKQKLGYVLNSIVEIDDSYINKIIINETKKTKTAGQQSEESESEVVAEAGTVLSGALTAVPKGPRRSPGKRRGEKDIEI